MAQRLARPSECIMIAALDHLQMGMGLFGGLAIFLYGMDQMTAALKAVAGNGMKRILAKLTSNRFMSVIAGAFVTAVIQSSSVTTVLVVGFVSAGLMTLQQSIGMIMGASIGTTVTAQIVAFKVTGYALIPVAVGFAMQFFSKRERVVQYGTMIFGFGLIFFGMFIMGEAMKPLRTHEPFIGLMRSMSNPLLAILISAAFTGLIQSSSATTAVIIMLAKSGFITLPAGIAMVLGANIGTCVTALLAAIGKPREAVQAAMVHLAFNFAGVLLWIGFIDQLAALVTGFSPAHPELTDPAQRLMAETPRQIANAHTIFNVSNTLVFLGLTQPMARFVQWIVPERQVSEDPGIQPKYLDQNLVGTPALAFDRVTMETERMARRAVAMVRSAPAIVMQGAAPELDALAAQDDDVDFLHTAIVSYLGELSAEELTEEQTEILHSQFSVVNYIENMADIVETNLIGVGRERLRREVRVSLETAEVLAPLIEHTTRAAAKATEAAVRGEPGLAREVIDAKAEISAAADAAYRHLVRRVGASGPDRVRAYEIEVELVEALKRLFYLSKRIAKVCLELDASSANLGTNA